MTHDQDWAIRQQQLAEVKAIEDMAMGPWFSLYRECEKQHDEATEPGRLKTALPWVPGFRLVVPTEEPINTADRREAVIAFCRKTLAIAEAMPNGAGERAMGKEKWKQERDTCADQHNWKNIIYLCEQRAKLFWHDLRAAVSAPFIGHAVRPSKPNE